MTWSATITAFEHVTPIDEPRETEQCVIAMLGYRFDTIMLALWW
jgi:hypothetical protein